MGHLGSSKKSQKIVIDSQCGNVGSFDFLNPAISYSNNTLYFYLLIAVFKGGVVKVEIYEVDTKIALKVDTF